ncbi:unnamed protein product [Lota lota]
MLKDIQERTAQLNPSIADVYNSNNKGSTMRQYFVNLVRTGSGREELEKQLAAVLNDTVKGMEKLGYFLEAIEKLAVTSLHVFPGEEIVETLYRSISMARLVCPLLLQFKRDASAFFLPDLHNVDVFVGELDKYIQSTEKICSTMGISSTTDGGHKQHSIHLAEDFTDDDMQNILSHVNQLSLIRMDPNFRLVYLFQEKPTSCFINQFTERRDRMHTFLGDMEGTAIQLNRMKMGSQISNVTGSSVGLVGGILGIAGLALAPVTAGVSLGLTLGGLGLGITSGVNSVVTTATEIAVNKTQEKIASELLHSFIEDMSDIQACLEEVFNQRETKGVDYLDVFRGVGQLGQKIVASGINITAFCENVSALNVLRNEELITSTGQLVLKDSQAGSSAAKMTSEIPDIGQAALKGPLALSKSARVVGITFNSLFIGLDIGIICKESIGLAYGDKSKVSQFIRSRAKLLRSELDLWQSLHDSLTCGKLTSESSKRILEIKLLKEKMKNSLASDSEGGETNIN